MISQIDVLFLQFRCIFDLHIIETCTTKHTSPWMVVKTYETEIRYIFIALITNDLNTASIFLFDVSSDITHKWNADLLLMISYCINLHSFATKNWGIRFFIKDTYMSSHVGSCLALYMREENMQTEQMWIILWKTKILAI